MTADEAREIVDKVYAEEIDISKEIECYDNLIRQEASKGNSEVLLISYLHIDKIKRRKLDEHYVSNGFRFIRRIMISGVVYDYLSWSKENK